MDGVAYKRAAVRGTIQLDSICQRFPSLQYKSNACKSRPAAQPGFLFSEIAPRLQRTT